MQEVLGQQIQIWTDPDQWRVLHQLHCPLQHQLAAVVVTKHAYTAWEAKASSLKARAWPMNGQW